MDYTVGSLSDLITGSNTPNKKKIVKKQKLQEQVPDSVDTDDPVEEVQSVLKKNKEKKVKTKKDKNLIKTEEPAAEKNPKKRKASSHESEPVPKKSKNTKNAEKRILSKESLKKPEEDPEETARTIFVGNLPITSDTKKFKKLFAKFGLIETVRIRGVPVADPKIPKKVALIKKEFHPERKSFYGFVRYADRASALKAVEANGMIYADHHLRVHLCDTKEKPDENKAIFVGNLSFYAEEDDLWRAFESCGPIASVRIVRDTKTGIGKGFGYVNFENSDAVTLALEMENVKIKDRELRITACNNNAAKKNLKKNKIKKITKPGKPKHQNKIKKERSDEDSQENKNLENGQDFENGNKSYQGVRFMEKKKKKFDKGLLLKKKKIRQIAPKQAA